MVGCLYQWVGTNAVEHGEGEEEPFLINSSYDQNFRSCQVLASIFSNSTNFEIHPKSQSLKILEEIFKNSESRESRKIPESAESYSIILKITRFVKGSFNSENLR